MVSKIVFLAFVAACSSSTQGVRPHDTSVAQHEGAATQHDTSAEAHVGQYDPNLKAVRSRCSPAGLDQIPICWTSVANPTAKHLRAVEEHRRRAAAHRAASAALRNAEATTCMGIGPDDRDTSPFDRVEDIASVQPLRKDLGRKIPAPVTIGAVVTFRARPGLTAEWLQRVVDCHLARNAALGHVVAEMPNCPLVPRGVRATVTSTGNGFAVAISSDDPNVAQEILDRALRAQHADDIAH